MPKFRTWEEECLPRLHVMDPTKPVALCVLWNLIEKMPEYAPGIEHAPGVAVIGNLRTPVGIGWFLRGLWKFPHIQRIILWGSDLTGSGAALVRLWGEGPDAGHRVPGFGWRIDPMISRAAIEELRETVSLIDLRHERQASRIVPHLTAQPGIFHRTMRDFPPVPVPERRILPSEPGAISIRAANPGDVWRKILHHLLQYGKPRDTRKKESIVHHFSMKTAFPVPAEDDPEGWFGISAADAERYLADVLRPTPPTAVDASGQEVSTVDYHYGQRIQDWLGHNQLREVVQRLRENPETKRASISILQAPDLEMLEDAPCWSLITFALIDGELYASNVFRSHDMFGGWPNNALAVLRIHRHVAKEVGAGLGSVEIISHNAQIYTRHHAAAEEWLATHGFTLANASREIVFRPDPAGSFSFTVLEDRRVRAQLVNPTGDEVLWETEHANPSVLIRWIVESMVLEPQHIRYLGSEEEKLNRSLKTGEPYHQG